MTARGKRGNVVPIRPAMLGAILNDRPAFTPSTRGYAVSYRVGQMSVPPCPGCGRTQWLVGRTMAECASCGLALPLDHSNR